MDEVIRIREKNACSLGYHGGFAAGVAWAYANVLSSIDDEVAKKRLKHFAREWAASARRSTAMMSEHGHLNTPVKGELIDGA